MASKNKKYDRIDSTELKLSDCRFSLAATSSGALVFFGGGYNTAGPSDRVDIYNVTSGSWTTATLSVPRGGLAAAASGNLVFFAGGWNRKYSNQVDIYNISNRSWSTATLSESRYALEATSVGNLVLFGGGYSLNGPSNVVDIYDVLNNTWTTATLSEARATLAATSVANRYALFAGGRNSAGSPSNVVDIYDLVLGRWSTATLSQARSRLAAASLDNLAFFGGGYDGHQASNVVDIFNATTKTWSTATLSQARYYLAAASMGDIVVFGGGDTGSKFSSVIDIYDLTTRTWSDASLKEARHSLAATSCPTANNFFFAGGINSSREDSKTVDVIKMLPKFEISPSEVTIGEVIAETTFRAVHKGTYRGLPVAVKKWKNIKNFSERDLQAFRHEFIKELKLLTVLNHPHIVRCFGGCTEHPNLFIVTEYCDGGSLYDLLHKKNVKLSTQQQFTYALGIAEGMKYLHTPKPVIAHRDLKSLNILFSNGIIKIIDFGLSRTKGTIHSLFKTRVGTYNWMAPEVMIHNQGYTEKADVWSFGMVLYEMTTNKIPYDYCGDDILKLTQEICDCKKLPPVPESLSIDPSLAAIMSKCWQWNPIDRPSFSEITETLKHEINKYNK